MTHNHLVPGSSPGGTTLKTPLLEGFFVFTIQKWCLCITYIFSTSQDYGTMCTILNKKVERFSVRH